MRVLWLLVGRGGSRGVVGKNLRLIEGRSLVDWKLAGALEAGARPEDMVVSSDDMRIRGEGLRCGATRAVVRPADLASDTATTASVVRHALDVVGADAYDAVCLLEPSSPFTRSETYRTALAMMVDRDADLVVGMKEVIPHPVFIGERREDDSVTGIILGFQRMARRRQDFKDAWTMSGGLYLFRTSMFEATNDVYGGVRNYGVMQDRWSGLEIDTMDDLELAEYAAGKGKVGYGT